MAKKTNSKISSSIKQNTIATNEGFNKLLELQQQTNNNLDSIRAVLTESIIAGKSAEIKEMKGIVESIRDIVKSSMVDVSPSSSNSPTNLVTKSKEEKNEEQMNEQKRDQLLIQIEKNTRPRDLSKAAGGDEKQGGGLGGWLMALAVGLGAIAGVIDGYIKSLRLFAEILTPDYVMLKLQKGFASFLAGLSMQYDLLKTAISEKFTTVVKFVDDILDSVKAVLTEKFNAVVKFFDGILDSMKVALSEKFPKIVQVFDDVIDGIRTFFSVGKDESFIARLYNSISSGLMKLFTPFVEAFEVVKNLLSGPSSAVFETIKSTFSVLEDTFQAFAKVFSNVMKVVSKLFIPLNVILTIWDTVKGAVEGYEEEGIVGAISGAIKGFFNSLIFGPIDLIKDATAWILGAFGFDKAEEVLKSFSVEKIFSSLVDAIFSPVETFKKIMNKFGEFLDGMSEFTIPEFGFKIPFTDKRVSVGPFKPFSALKGLVKTEEAPKAVSERTTKTVGTTPPIENGSSPTANKNLKISRTETYDAEKFRERDPENFNKMIERSNELEKELTKKYPGVKPEQIRSLAQERAKEEYSRQILASGAGTSELSWSSVKPPAASTGNIVSQQSANNNMLRDQRVGAPTTVIAPNVNNNMSTTQVAKIEAPVRNNDASVDRYMASRASW